LAADVPQSRVKGDLWAIMSAVTTAVGLVAAKTALKSIDTFTFNAYLFAIGAAVTFGEASVSRNIGQAVRITSFFASPCS
jgi:hypothetical protein